MHSFLKLVADGLPRLPIAQCGANKGTSTCLLASALSESPLSSMIMDTIPRELHLRIFNPSMAPGQLALSNKESEYDLLRESCFACSWRKKKCRFSCPIHCVECAKFAIICNGWPGTATDLPDGGSAGLPTLCLEETDHTESPHSSARVIAQNVTSAHYASWH